jgi:hypothetical protein
VAKVSSYKAGDMENEWDNEEVTKVDEIATLPMSLMREADASERSEALGQREEAEAALQSEAA